ncbi:hypothetical protein HOE67_00450 [Candidatus Peregrinibacteria bacterium]|nr:hypothetical protein [Candidatus Peregrinibacteria bacterium]
MAGPEKSRRSSEESREDVQYGIVRRKEDGRIIGSFEGAGPNPDDIEPSVSDARAEFTKERDALAAELDGVDGTSDPEAWKKKLNRFNKEWHDKMPADFDGPSEWKEMYAEKIPQWIEEAGKSSMLGLVGVLQGEVDFIIEQFDILKKAEAGEIENVSWDFLTGMTHGYDRETFERYRVELINFAEAVEAGEEGLGEKFLKIVEIVGNFPEHDEFAETLAVIRDRQVDAITVVGTTNFAGIDELAGYVHMNYVLPEEFR